MHTFSVYKVSSSSFVIIIFFIILSVNCFGRTMLYMYIEYHI